MILRSFGIRKIIENDFCVKKLNICLLVYKYCIMWMYVYVCINVNGDGSLKNVCINWYLCI